MPLQEKFRAGVLTLGWDPTTSQVVVEAAPPPELDLDQVEALQEDPENFELEVEPDEVFIVRIPVGAARAFIDRTRSVVAAGRDSA